MEWARACGDAIVPLTLVDSHCHLDLAQFDDDRAEVLQRAHDAGVSAFVIPGIDLAQNRAALAFAGEHDDIYVAIGVHPNNCADFDDAALDALEVLAMHERVVAVGEIGLDFYWKDVEPEQQRRVFRSQLALAARLGKPVIIHSRDANDEVRAILRDWVASREFRSSALARRPFTGVLHAFSGDIDFAREAWSWGFAISLGGPVTFRNAHALHALVPHLELNRLMLETDSPYLTPHPYRGKRNEPAFVALVCQEIARLQGIAPDLVAEVTTSVAARFFGLETVVGAGRSALNHA